VTATIDELAARAAELTKKHRELLADIEWREKDLEDEHAKLIRLRDDQDPESLILLGPQVVVVETIEKVLENERAELAAIEAEIKTLEAELRQRVPTSKSAGPGSSE